MWGGALLVTVGVWALCQVLGGNALGRLGVSGEPTVVGRRREDSGGGAGSATRTAPDTGIDWSTFRTG